MRWSGFWGFRRRRFAANQGWEHPGRRRPRQASSGSRNGGSTSRWVEPRTESPEHERIGPAPSDPARQTGARSALSCRAGRAKGEIAGVSGERATIDRVVEVESRRRRCDDPIRRCRRDNGSGRDNGSCWCMSWRRKNRSAGRRSPDVLASRQAPSTGIAHGSRRRHSRARRDLAAQQRVEQRQQRAAQVRALQNRESANLRSRSVSE